MRKYTLTHDIPDCDFIDVPLRRGDTVYGYSGCTYGCIDGTSEVACTLLPNELPFFGLPVEALIHEDGTPVKASYTRLEDADVSEAKLTSGKLLVQEAEPVLQGSAA